MRHELEDSRATAILEPTPGNVAAYLYLQQESLQRASTFSDVFRRVVWSTPELDYTLTRPAGALAKQLWSDERLAAHQAALANLGDRYGLDLPRRCRLRRLPGVRAAVAGIRDPSWPGRAGGVV